MIEIVWDAFKKLGVKAVMSKKSFQSLDFSTRKTRAAVAAEQRRKKRQATRAEHPRGPNAKPDVVHRAPRTQMQKICLRLRNAWNSARITYQASGSWHVAVVSGVLMLIVGMLLPDRVNDIVACVLLYAPLAAEVLSGMSAFL